MKKMMIVALSLLFAAYSFSYSRTIKVSETGPAGSASGYQKFEEHDDGGFLKGSKSTLLCTAPGPAQCVWNIDPRTLPDMFGPNNSNPEWADLKTYAISQITGGTLSGSYVNNIVINGDSWYRNVTWNSTNITNYNVEIEIQLAP